MTEILIKIDVDKCISSEIKELNDRGIVTHNSCCGHGYNNMSYIEVRTVDNEKMRQLGYVQIKGSTFRPKFECSCIPIIKVCQCLDCKNHFDESCAHIVYCSYCGSSNIKIKEIYSTIKIPIYVENSPFLNL